MKKTVVIGAILLNCFRSRLDGDIDFRVDKFIYHKSIIDKFFLSFWPIRFICIKESRNFNALCRKNASVWIISFGKSLTSKRIVTRKDFTIISNE